MEYAKHRPDLEKTVWEYDGVLYRETSGPEATRSIPINPHLSLTVVPVFGLAPAPEG